MTSNDRLSVPEQAEEVRARGEDRLIDVVVPRLDHLAETVTVAVTHLREKLDRTKAR